jgi:hypothetical protein
MRRVGLRSLVLIAVFLGFSIPAAPVVAGPAIDLPGLPIEYDRMPPISGRSCATEDPM